MKKNIFVFEFFQKNNSKSWGYTISEEIDSKYKLKTKIYV